MTQIAQYRQDFRRYLRELDWAAEWRNAAFYSAEDGVAHDARVLARLHEDGWNRYGWPESAGGVGGNEIHRAVYYEELSHAMSAVPAQHWTLETPGPALLKFAPGLAAQYLPGFLDGSEWCGQCFFEPDSGSDLATLRTRAVAGGDGNFVVNGQKIWTSQGPTATRLLVLVRTGAPETRRRGLTMIMVDAEAPGVTVRPIALASGRRELAEVLFDDVAVPRERVIGEIDGGWTVAMHLMQYERGRYGYAVLTELARLRKDMVAGGSSPAQREWFGRVFVDVVSAQARTATTVRKLADGTTIGAGSSVDKLLISRVVVQSCRKRAQRPDSRRTTRADDRRRGAAAPRRTRLAPSGGTRARRRSWAERRGAAGHGALPGSDGLAESGDAGRTGDPPSAGGHARRETIESYSPGSALPVIVDCS